MRRAQGVKKQNVVLAVLAASPLGMLGPVQMQKALFLIDKRIPTLIDGPIFAFRPYHYGPFDAEVYRTLEYLAAEGAVEIEREPSARRNSYRITAAGLERGRNYLRSIPSGGAKFIAKVATFVHTVSFSELVSSIYRAYPEMKQNSVFASR